MSLEDMPAGRDWTLGVKVTRADAVKMQVAELQTSPAHPLEIANLARLPDSSVVEKPGRVELTGLGGLQSSLVAYVEVPPGTRIAVEVNGREAAAFRATQDVMVQNGVVRDHEVNGIGAVSLAAAMSHVKPEPTDVDVVRLSGSVYKATTAGLRRHLLSYTRPAALTNVGLHEPSFVVVMLKIDPEGRVADARPASGDTMGGQACAAAARRWRFSPFEVAGRGAVPVFGRVSCTFSGQTVRTSMTQ